MSSEYVDAKQNASGTSTDAYKEKTGHLEIQERYLCRRHSLLWVLGSGNRLGNPSMQQVGALIPSSRFSTSLPQEVMCSP